MNRYKTNPRSLRKLGGVGARGSLSSWKAYSAAEGVSSGSPERRLDAVFDNLIKTSGLISYQVVIRCVRYRGRMETFTVSARGLSSIFSTLGSARNVDKLVRTIKQAVNNYNGLVTELRRSEGDENPEVSGLLAALQEVMLIREKELAAVGINVDPERAVLDLDEAKMAVAAGTSYRKVRSMFAGSDGLGVALSRVIRPVVSQLAGEYLLASRFDQSMVSVEHSPYFATFSSGLFYDLLI